MVANNLGRRGGCSMTRRVDWAAKAMGMQLRDFSPAEDEDEEKAEVEAGSRRTRSAHVRVMCRLMCSCACVA